MRTVGVEEELLLLDAESGEPRALSTAVLAAARRDSTVSGEVFEAPCSSWCVTPWRTTAT